MTIGRGSAASEPMADLGLFDVDIRGMQHAAEAAGELEWLRLSMDALIANPRGRIGQFVGQGYPFTEDEMVRLFTYAFGLIWPEQSISSRGEEAQLRFVDMTDEQWLAVTQPSDSDELF